MTDMPLANLPEYQCYDCHGCAACCRGIFTIALSEEEIARLQAQEWEKEPGFKGVKLMVPYGEKMRLNHRKGGDCVFLDADRRCRIHAKFGADAKPLACRAYPFKHLPTGAGVRVDLRYDCPAVATNFGRPLSAHREELQGLAAEVIHGNPAEMAPPRFTEEIVTSWSHAERVADFFLRLLTGEECDLTTRVVSCVDAITLLGSLRIDQLDDASLTTLLHTMQQKAVKAMLANPLERSAPPAMVLTAFRQHLCLYGREDRWGAKSSFFQRLRVYLGMVNGSGFVPCLREDFPHVPFFILDDPLGIPPDEVVEPIVRYLRLRLESLGFFGQAFYNYPLLDGLSALLLTYPMAFWFARAYAVGRHLPAPDAACVARGVQLANHAYGISPVQNLPVERARLASLCKRPVLSKLVTWYGR
jgi:lysine-N-methylase